ncbi:hypothetical protein FB107DRAFT_261944 [Schizophyllum commune]
MTSTTPAPDPNLPDAAPSAVSNEVGRTGLHYPDARLAEAPYPYLLRTRVNKEVISDVERTTVQSCSIISRDIFRDDIFPVEPAELVVDLDKITYDLDNQRWLLDYPRTLNSESPCPTRPANGFRRAAPAPSSMGRLTASPGLRSSIPTSTRNGRTSYAISRWCRQRTICRKLSIALPPELSTSSHLRRTASTASASPLPVTASSWCITIGQVACYRM